MNVTLNIEVEGYFPADANEVKVVTVNNITSEGLSELLVGLLIEKVTNSANQPKKVVSIIVNIV